MDNNWTSEIENDVEFIPEQMEDHANVHLWKTLYSHSYTLLFRCENCDHNFDIDGWFYTFNSIQCPKCRTLYSGIFGQIKETKEISSKEKYIDRYFLETFEGEELEIRLPSGSCMVNGRANHIALTIFNRIPDKPGKPWGIVDYSDKKPELKLFRDMKKGEPGYQRPVQKPKSFLAGLLSG